MEGLVASRISKDFWAGKRTLVTGHTGFKGSWLSLWLQSMGARVAGYSLAPPTHPSMFEAARVADGMISIRGDVRDFDSLLDAFSEHKPEIVVHMAAQALVRYSYNNPLETYSTNVIGTANVLEAVRLVKSVKVVLIVTSDKCYENQEWIWGYRENDRLGGRDPYSNSKACAELVTAAYRSSFFPESQYRNHGVAVASVRAGNVVGGGDWSEDRLVPDLVKAFQAGRAAVIRNPQSIRPWQYVLEPLHGYLFLVERLWEKGPDFCGGWNFGPSAEEGVRTVSWVADKMTELWKGKACWQSGCESMPLHEANLLMLDCSKARTLLQWKPKLSLHDALTRIVGWYQSYHSGKDMQRVSFGEIAYYEQYGGPVMNLQSESQQ